jgi:exopolyphosphatase/guanosine-5'-triphosphate,3'-diphosphate pyrophosphatase
VSEAATSLFPVRVGAIDVGSNAIRLVAVEFTDPENWLELDSRRVPVRLGHSSFLTGRLHDRLMTGAVDAMSTFRQSFDRLGISRYRAVATSAVRESENGGELVRRIRDETGIRLETITGSEEIRLVWLATRRRIELEDKRWLLADLGGGSLELSLADGDRIRWSVSHQIGTVRLLEDLEDSSTSPENFRRLVAEYARVLRLPRAVKRSAVAGVIATGGNADALAAIAGATPDQRGVRRLSAKQLKETARLLGSLSVRERMARFDLKDDRADVVFPAALVYDRVVRLIDAPELVVPGVGVKEGILLDLVDDLSGPAVHATRIEQQLLNAGLALGRRYRFDEAHGKQVARLALSLFDQMGKLHGLGPVDRKILLAAALLHDIGQIVSYRRHHKHSMYLILNSELPGLADDDVPLVALVARYHRRAEPSDDHELYNVLSSEDRERVRKLASILRVADALDREHLQRVERVEAHKEKDRLLLDLTGRGDLLLEHWAIRRKAKMFRSTYDLEVTLAQHASGPALI